MRVEILGKERRRRWNDEKKRDIVMSVGIDGATVSEVAHQHDVTRQQIYTWRRELKKKALLSQSSKVAFVPVEIPALQDDPVRGDALGGVAGMIELRLNCGRSLRFDSGVDTVVLTRLVRAVETA
ncbi:MAG: transposase [Pararhizobium sp.]